MIFRNLPADPDCMPRPGFPFKGVASLPIAHNGEAKPARGLCYSPGWSRLWLLTEDKMSAAILLPAGFSVLVTSRPFLAVADGLDGPGWNAKVYQRLLDGVSAVLTERQIIFGGATLVT